MSRSPSVVNGVLVSARAPVIVAAVPLTLPVTFPVRFPLNVPVVVPGSVGLLGIESVQLPDPVIGLAPVTVISFAVPARPMEVTAPPLTRHVEHEMAGVVPPLLDIGPTPVTAVTLPPAAFAAW
jgi:hypothetical protein